MATSTQLSVEHETLATIAAASDVFAVIVGVRTDTPTSEFFAHAFDELVKATFGEEIEKASPNFNPGVAAIYARADEIADDVLSQHFAALLNMPVERVVAMREALTDEEA